MTIEHVSGERFKRTYQHDDLTATVRDSCHSFGLYLDARTMVRLQDLGLNVGELIRTIENGEVISYEVGPSLTEIRLEMSLNEGDMAGKRPVVWLSSVHELHCTDVRD